MNHSLRITLPFLVLLALASLSCTAFAQPKTPPVPAGVKYEQDIVYGTGAGEKLHLDLARPEKADAPVPCIVVIHGGGWRQGDKRAHTDLVLGIAARGYVAATVQYRFCPKHRFPAQVEDVKCAVRFLRAHAKEYGIDANRFGAVGASAGAHLAMMLATMGRDDGLEGEGGWPEQSSRVQAAVSFFGPTDLAADDFGKVTQALLNDFLGSTKEENAEVRKTASPITYVTSDDAPILLLQGTKDPLVPHSQAYAMADALSEAGVAGRLEIILGAGHGWGGGELKRTIDVVNAFFDQHLAKK